MGAGHRARDPRAALDAHEDVLRLRAVVRRAAEHAHVPGLPRPPGHAADAQRRGGALRADDRASRSAARSRRARSSTARTTSIPTCRRATRSASTTSRWRRAARSQVPGGPTVRIHRAHLEEDAAKLIHLGESGRIHGAGASVVDFNRGGTPLVEIVTEPDLRTAAGRARVPAAAAHDAEADRRVRREHGGGLAARATRTCRCDPRAASELRTKTELKNMNSFRFLERGIEAEIERQIAIWESGEPVVQETLHFDPVERLAHAAALEGGGARLPLLPRARPRAAGADRGDARARARRAAGAARGAARALRSPSTGCRPTWPATLVRWSELGASSRRAWPRRQRRRRRARALDDRRAGRAPARARPRGPARVEALARRAGRARRDGRGRKLSQSAAKEVLAELTANGGDPAAIVEAKGLAPIADSGELEAIVERAIEANPGAVEQIRRRQGAGRRRDRRRRDEGDEGPRRRRRGQPPDQGEARALGRSTR